ncbi:Metal resistance protein YCF1 [Rhizoctonia solani]|uniref:Metal resistance protein YCF1 n=1 Tax=Rhizoctonia solani TaxID=456999 RepID=A0A0K6G7B6_9AGAM|nr:Metal resistance protein YCF1 [Rhizoctonia solani]
MSYRPLKRLRTSTSTKPTLSPLFEGDNGRQDQEDTSRRSRPSRAWLASGRDPDEVFALLDMMVEWKRHEEQEELKRKNEMEREREREIYFSVTKDEQMLSDAEGVKRFQIFEERVRSLDLKLQSFQNAVGQLGSGVGLLNAARHLKDRLAQLEALFRRNVRFYMHLGDKGTYLTPFSLAAELFGEIPHPPMNKSTSDGPTQGATKRRSVINPVAPYNAPIIENLPNELQLLAGNLKTLLDRLNEVPEFTDEAVNSPIKAFQDDLQYRFSCLREFEEQIKVLAVARYINDLTEDLGSHMDNMKNSLNIFIDVGVPTIRFYQTHAATGLQNLSTVATFLSGVTATTLQFSYQSRGQLLPDSVNALWISSLVLSIASAINSQLAYHWRVAMYRSPNHYVPGWVSIWITHTPLFFLVISVIAFSIGLCAFTYSSDQSRAVSTLVTAFTAVTSLALLCVGLWFGSERLAYTHTGGSRWLLPVLKEHMGNAKNSTGSALNFFKEYISKVAQWNTPRNAEAEEPRTEEPHEESLTIVSGAALSAGLQERNVGLNSDGNPNRNPVGGIPLPHAPGELPSDIPPRERLRRAFRRSNTAANRALVNRVMEMGKGVETLTAKVASFELDKSMLRDRIDALEDANENVEKAMRQMNANLNTQEHHIAYLQSLLRINNAASHTKLPPDLLDADADPNLALDDTDVISLTVDEDRVQRDGTLKQVVYKCLCEMCGVPHFHDLCYMIFPGVDEGNPSWPSTTNEKGERCPYMRLDYNKPFDDPRNWAQLTLWADHVMNHGASVMPEAAALLSKLSIEQVRTACKLRFQYLRKDFKSKVKKFAEVQVQATANENSLPIDPILQPPNAPQIPPVDPPYPATSIPELRSRAKGKSKLRAAKRERLTGDAAKFQAPKYDSYFQPGAMSDDEDKYNLVDGVWVKVPNLFESREYDFISEECRDAVDAVPNPSEKSRPTPRVRGLPKPGPPRKAVSVPWALRAWMINSRVLAANTWLADGLVLANGVAWGDASEPALRKSGYGSKKRRHLEENQAGPSNVLIESARKARRAMEEAKRQAEGVGEQPEREEPMEDDTN